MRTLNGRLSVEVLWGEPKPGAPSALYFVLRHSKLPERGIMFAMTPDWARDFAALIVAKLSERGERIELRTVGDDEGDAP